MMKKFGFEFARKMKDGKPVLVGDKEAQAYEGAQIPEYQTKKSAGADFFAAEDTVVPSFWNPLATILKTLSPFTCSEEYKNEKKALFAPTLVHTGIKVKMEADQVLHIYNRSSNPKKLGLILANSVGVIDADYYNNPDNDGEIMFAFYNLFPWNITIKAGDRIGQGEFVQFLRPTIGLRVKDQERKGGFGSTK